VIVKVGIDTGPRNFRFVSRFGEGVHNSLLPGVERHTLSHPHDMLSERGSGGRSPWHGSDA
jgi:hypothetical protein